MLLVTQRIRARQHPTRGGLMPMPCWSDHTLGATDGGFAADGGLIVAETAALKII
ncbi:MAG: hypothetical protein VXW22_13750 [Pseudomonadota bacterium]|nr:hypothetical protein [Pseudomonadota bacterium]